MPRVIITNGDHAANALAAHFPDAEILIWRDVLIEGPVPSGIDDDALADIRARHIEEAFGVSDVRADFTRRDIALRAIPASAQVELWFETDLHDQLQLIQILSLINARADRPELRLTLAPPPLMNQIDEMARTLAAVGEHEIAEGAELWNAFRAPTPDAVVVAMKTDGALREVRTSFARMLEEYPGRQDGLGRIERSALLAIRDGAVTPGLAFRHYQQAEALPFLGDLGFYYRLDQLASGPSPLLQGLPDDGVAQAARTNMTVEYTHTPVELTAAGHAVLEGRADHITLNGIDRWLGGVHLTNEKFWRYDPESKTLTRG